MAKDGRQQQKGEEAKQKKRSVQDDDHLSNCRLTRSAFKKQQLQQQAEGKGKKHAKKKGKKRQPWWKKLPTIPMSSLRDFTREELQRYKTMVQQSDGFDVGYVPDEIFMDIIVPLNFENYDRGTRKIYENMSKKAIQEYNAQHGTTYEFVKLIRLNRKAVAGRLYFLTFEAKEDTTDAAPQNFQARVFCSIHSTTEVQFCRVEKQYSKLPAGS